MDGDVTLRAYTDADHARTFTWLQEPELRRFTGTTAPPTPETHADWLQRMRFRESAAIYAIERGGAHIGNLFLMDIDRINLRAEIQLFLGPPEILGRGAGTAALVAAKAEAFGKLGLNRLYAFVFAFNQRAKRAFEKAGFVLEGRMRQHKRDGETFVEVFVLGCLKGDG
jgi:RimJ/RimL family protein N-acetyltransferase